jgi:hypothetical protein
MRKLGLVSRWLLVGLVGVMLIMAGISRIVDAQTGGCPNLEAVEGGWGNWSSCFQSQQDGIWKCIAYRFPDTCVQTWRRTLCKPYGTDPTYSWKPLHFYQTVGGHGHAQGETLDMETQAGSKLTT